MMRMPAPIVLRVLIALFFLAGVLACGGSSKPPKSTPVPSTAVAAAAGTATPGAGVPVAAGNVEEQKVEDSSAAFTYVYSPVGKRDPFRSFFKELKTLRPEKGVPGDILTTFELDQLKLVAVISGIPQPKAMVEDPGGKGYVVKLGSRVGKNFGTVVRIHGNEMVIAEDYRDWNGRKVTNYIHVAIERDKETK